MIQQTPNSYPYSNMYGGYPNMGYPPNIPNIGYQSQQQFEMPIPGVTAPLEITTSSGTTVINPPQYTNMYIPGGTTSYQGGFNPVAGVVTQPSASQGFNPFQQFIGNPGYGYSMPQQQYTPTPIQNPQYGFSPYSPPFQKPYATGLYGVPLYGQNQFNTTLADCLYNEDEYCMDNIKMIEEIILTDEERSRVERNRGFNGCDYYGRPVYNNILAESQRRQQEFEEARRSYQNHFTMLSRIAHAYSGETIDEEATMRRFDPVPPQPKVQNQTKLIDYQNANADDRKKYEKEIRYQNAEDIARLIDYRKFQEQSFINQRNYMFNQIKASHDRMIGVQPGESYDLKTYMDNGYKLGVNLMMKQAKQANRNGSWKYSRNDYRADLSQKTNQQIPITSKDDEYVSIESMLKNVFDRNRSVNTIFKSQNGDTSILSQPAIAFGSEREAHMYFLQKMQENKNVNDVRMEARDTTRDLNGGDTT